MHVAHAHTHTHTQCMHTHTQCWLPHAGYSHAWGPLTPTLTTHLASRKNYATFVQSGDSEL